MLTRDRLSRIATERALDVAVSGGLSLWVVMDAVGVEASGPSAIGRVLAGWAITLALLWRRTNALSVVLLLATVITVASLVTEPPESVWLLIATIVTSYSAGAFERSALRSLASLAVLGGAVAVSIARDVSDTATNIAPTLIVFLVVPWIAGRALHTGERRSETLGAKVLALENEQALLAREAVAAERSRLARELHDVVAHSLSVIAIQADAAEGALTRDPELAEAPLAAVKVTAREALTEMRHLLGLLRDTEDSPSLEPQPGLARIEALVNQVRSAGLGVDLVIENAVTQLPPGVDLSAYRIIQEGLTNALKHGGATHARVLMRYLPERLEIEVTDNGQPSSIDNTGTLSSSGQGLVGMRERVALYGGTLHVGPLAGGGFSVIAQLPR